MKIRLDKQKLYSWIIVYMLSFLAFLNLGNELLNLIGIRVIWDTVLLYGLLVGLILIGIVLCIKDYNRFKIDVFFVILFFLTFYSVSTLINPKNAVYLFTSWMDYSTNPVYVIFLYSLPGYIFMRKLKQYDYLILYMKYFSYIVVCMSILVFLFSRDSAAAQYMTFSYNMLTQLFFLIVYTPNKNRTVHYIIVACGIFVFLFGGARGATIALLIAGIMFYLLSHKLTSKTIGVIFLTTICVGFFIIFKKQILVAISELLEIFSLNSRTFYMLLNGEILSDSNRLELYQIAWENIGILGKGFMGDRVILKSYPHNLFLEILVQFGWIVGLIIWCFICYCIIGGLFKKEKAEFVFICLLIPCGFIKLMMTGSYLNQEPAFYILMGLCINSRTRRDKICGY